jgi:hypothetical protein
MHLCSNVWCVVTRGTSLVSPCPQPPAHRTFNTPGAPTGFAVKTAAVSLRSTPRPTCPNLDSTRMRATAQRTNKKPTRDHSPMGCAANPNSQHTLLVTATAAKIEMKPRQADVPAAAAMTGAVPTTMTRTRTAAMTDRAVAIHRLSTAVVASDDALAIHGRSARAAVVRHAAAGVTVRITRLHRGRSENGEAGSDRQKGDELFHDALGFGLSRCRQSAACQSDAAQMRLFSSNTLFSFL